MQCTIIVIFFFDVMSAAVSKWQNLFFFQLFFPPSFKKEQCLSVCHSVVTFRTSISNLGDSAGATLLVAAAPKAAPLKLMICAIMNGSEICKFTATGSPNTAHVPRRRANKAGSVHLEQQERDTETCSPLGK